MTRSKTRRRAWRWLAVPALVALLTLGLASVALANLPGSTFEGNDGNLVVDTAGNKDWANAPNLVVGIDQPSGTSDNSFGGAPRRTTPTSTW
jgi:hypothetical protein